MKEKSKFAGLFVFCVSIALHAAIGDPQPPCYPNCPTNVIYDPPSFPTPAYTNGELAARIQSHTDSELRISATNVNAFREYALQFSPAIPASSWVMATGSLIGNTNEVIFTAFDGESSGFFRVADVTGDDVIIYPTYGGGSYAEGTGCPGENVGGYTYRPVNTIFPFDLAPGATNISIIDPSSNPDVRFEFVGRYNDFHCGSTPLNLPASALPDPHYSLKVYFKTTMPGTNYPVVLKGLKIRTDVL